MKDLALNSQNRRRLTVTRNPWRSSPPRQGHLEQFKKEQVYLGFECLHRGRIHDLLGQPVLVLCHLQHKEFLPQLEVKFLMF